jgi:hypothetical protein
MSDEFEEKFIKPIINACYPGTLAGLALAVLQITLNIPEYLKIVLLTSALAFTMSAFFIFFYSIYPARKKLWTLSAMSFLSGLSCSILAIVLLFVAL